MKNKESNFPKLKGLIEKAVKEGFDKKELITETTLYWFRYYNYSHDPLDSFNPEVHFDSNLMELFVNRKAEIEVIAKYFGSAQKLAVPIHVAIIGLKGIGKHTTMKIVCEVIANSFPEITFTYYNYYGYNFKTHEVLEEMELKELETNPIDVRILSCDVNTRSFLIKRLKKYRKNTKIIFTIWNSHEYPVNNDIMVNKEIYFRNYDKNTISEILKRRVERFLISKTKSNDYFKHINEFIIPQIAKFSKGNLFIAFYLFKILHQESRIKNLKIIHTELLENIIKKLTLIKNVKITENENSIIRFQLLNGIKFITTSILVKELNFDRTVAWKYLEALNKKGMVRKTYGNPSKYEINEIFISFYEEKLKNEIIFK